MNNRASGKIAGHIAALVTIAIWGTTFISTKVLLDDFQPIEILLYRFAVGYLVLLAICPKQLRPLPRVQEFLFVAAGLCGICLYYLLENIALTFTFASNVGVIASVAPFFTALLAHVFMKAEGRISVSFVAGFAVAMAGVSLISFNGSEFHVSPVGDLLALVAAFVWACYSLLSRKVNGFGLPVVAATRKTFFYGLVFMVPLAVLSGLEPNVAALRSPVNVANLAFLGLGASALCFVTWNFAVRELGAVKTSAYIYLAPVVTVATGAIVLREPVTLLVVLGTALTLVGLVLSEFGTKRRR